jgi:hypothetical protein
MVLVQVQYKYSTGIPKDASGNREILEGPSYSLRLIYNVNNSVLGLLTNIVVLV